MDQRLIIVSNRLPYKVYIDDQGKLKAERSAGGLASALGPLHDQDASLWVGWNDHSAIPLLPNHKRHDAKTIHEANDLLRSHRCIPIELTTREAKGYYDGFSNSTIWPLFHDFPHFAHFEEDTWKTYVAVNRHFCDAIADIYQPGDIIWIQDYHLMLLPDMLRCLFPSATIGFFLHIPFPDYEEFRKLPWRSEILSGLLGADLIGFHTYDYVRHFLTSCHRVLGREDHFGSFLINDRTSQADVFPLGIDYQRFARQVRSTSAKKMIRTFRREHSSLKGKVMLSVERLDYSKGIPDRLLAFEAFLKAYPEWIEKVTLVLITVPSRENVTSYHALKRSIDELVGRINGELSTVDWQPIDYYYRSIPFESLCTIYRASDVMLVTPLRDGMNLVSKEYLAAHDGTSGVLILSEMAGSVHELSDALIVNPFDQHAIVEAIHKALTMPKDEQIRRNETMQKRLKRYTSDKWAHQFLHALSQVKESQQHLGTARIDAAKQTSIAQAFRNAHRKVLLLDYDGTLMPFSKDPRSVVPDKKLITLLKRLSEQNDTTVVILSGRDKQTLGTWLGDLSIDMVAEHGVWFWDKIKHVWILGEPMDASWKKRIRPIVEDYVDRTPGSSMEEKDYSLVWHYRTCIRDLADRRVCELKNDLSSVVDDLGLTIMDGNKVIEIKPASIEKGAAAHRWFRDKSYDFILVAGDDVTDESMFHAAPDNALTIKVGNHATYAHLSVENVEHMRKLLSSLVNDTTPSN